MKSRWILAGACVLALATPVASQARSHCEAAAQQRRVAGTVIGAVGGAVIGNQISHNGGTLVGGLVGGYAGNQLSRTHCPHGVASRSRRAYGDPERRTDAQEAQASPTGRCAMEDRPFYDAHGELVHRQVQACR
jgi:hypothetical protein